MMLVTCISMGQEVDLTYDTADQTGTCTVTGADQLRLCVVNINCAAPFTLQYSFISETVALTTTGGITIVTAVLVLKDLALRMLKVSLKVANAGVPSFTLLCSDGLKNKTVDISTLSNTACKCHMCVYYPP